MARLALLIPSRGYSKGTEKKSFQGREVGSTVVVSHKDQENTDIAHVFLIPNLIPSP